MRSSGLLLLVALFSGCWNDASGGDYVKDRKWCANDGWCQPGEFCMHYRDPDATFDACFLPCEAGTEQCAGGKPASVCPASPHGDACRNDRGEKVCFCR